MEKELLMNGNKHVFASSPKEKKGIPELKFNKLSILPAELKYGMPKGIHKIDGITKTNILEKYEELIDKYWIISKEKLSNGQHLKVLIKVKLKDKREFLLKIEEFAKTNTKNIEAALHEYYIGKSLMQFTKETIIYFNMCETELEDHEHIRTEILTEYGGMNLRENDIFKRKALWVICKLVQFLAFMEICGVSFIGVKPENILWNETVGTIKFKCSRSSMIFYRQPEMVHKPLRKNANYINKLSCYYAPPELARLDSPETIIPQKVDAFSFGITFTELLMCDRGKTLTHEVMETERQLTHFIKNLNELLDGSQWIPLITKCLDFNPNKRPTFAEIQSEFYGNIMELQSEISLNKADFEAYLAQGNCKLNLRQYAPAAMYYQLYIQYLVRLSNEKYPSNDILFIYNNLAFAYNQLGLYSKAVICLHRIESLHTKIIGKECIDLALANDYVSLAANYIELGKPKRVLEYLDKAEKLFKEFKAEPDMPTINCLYGRANNNLGQYKKSRDYLQKALDEIKDKDVIDHAAFGLIQDYLGNTIFKMGDYTQSIQSFTLAKKKLKSSYGPQSIEISRTYINLGLVYSKLSKHAESIDYLQKAVNIQIKLCGLWHPFIGEAFNSMGIAYIDAGDYSIALEYLHKASAIRKENCGYFNTDLAETYNLLGYVYCCIGEYRNALRYLEKAENILYALFPLKETQEEKQEGKQENNKQEEEKHPEKYTNLLYKGKVLHCLGKYKEAIELFQKAEASRAQLFGEESFEVAQIYVNLGETYEKQGTHGKAREYLHKAEKIFIRLFSEDNHNIAVVYNCLGNLYSNMDNEKRAIDYITKAEKIITLLYGEDHYELSITYNNLGLCSCRAGDYKIAIEYYLKAIQINVKKCGTKNPLMAKTYNNIGCAYQKLGNYKTALKYYMKAKRILNKVYLEYHIDLADVYNNLGQIYENLGKYAKSLKCYSKVVKFRSKIGGEDRYYANAYNNLATAYYNIQEYSSSIEYYGKAADILVKLHGLDHQDVAQVYIGLARSYFWAGNHAKAIEYYLKIQTMKWK